MLTYTGEPLERFSEDGRSASAVSKLLQFGQSCHFESPFRLKIYEWSMGNTVFKVNAFDLVLQSELRCFKNSFKTDLVELTY